MLFYYCKSSKDFSFPQTFFEVFLFSSIKTKKIFYCRLRYSVCNLTPIERPMMSQKDIAVPWKSERM